MIDRHFCHPNRCHSVSIQRPPKRLNQARCRFCMTVMRYRTDVFRMLIQHIKPCNKVLINQRCLILNVSNGFIKFRNNEFNFHCEIFQTESLGGLQICPQYELYMHGAK